ncbi:MAG: hypothetical protein L0221_13640 [Chloroflexi bacterium]|nr:hypothetical protein [Chloroflexota bacterium]
MTALDIEPAMLARARRRPRRRERGHRHRAPRSRPPRPARRPGGDVQPRDPGPELVAPPRDARRPAPGDRRDGRAPRTGRRRRRRRLAARCGRPRAVRWPPDARVRAPGPGDGPRRHEDRRGMARCLDRQRRPHGDLRRGGAGRDAAALVADRPPPADRGGRAQRLRGGRRPDRRAPRR